MLGLLLIYWVGKAFYELAEKHSRNGWGHAILGVAIYYVAQITFALLAYIAIDLAGSGNGVESSETAVTLISIPVSAVACWGYYSFIKGRWENSALVDQNVSYNSDLLDDDMLFS